MHVYAMEHTHASITSAFLSFSGINHCEGVLVPLHGFLQSVSARKQKYQLELI